MASYRYPAKGGGGGGDVAGPASATDNNIATFDGTTGKLIQDSGVAIGAIAAAQADADQALIDAAAAQSDADQALLDAAAAQGDADQALLDAAAAQTTANAAQPGDADLTALAGISTNGLLARTGAGTAAARTITAGAGITVNNGDGAAGNPEIVNTVTQYTDELAQDAVGGMVADSTTVALAYVDATPSLTASVRSDSLTNTEINSAAAIAYTKLANLTDGRALVSSSSKVAVATTTATEIGYVNGVTSAIQTQLDAKLCATSVAAVSTDVTLTNKRIHLVDTSAARSLTLPSPSAGAYIVVKDAIGSAQTNNITIVRAGSEEIETVAASFVLDTNLGSWTFVSDGTDWFII